MIDNNEHYSVVALDVGDKRIGVAHAETSLRLPVPYTTIDVDGLEVNRLREVVAEFEPKVIVVGFPRNQQGETTQQTQKVKDFSQKLEQFGKEVVFQDESLTSVLALEQLQASGRPFSKPDIDAQAAAIILGDYLGVPRG